MRLEAFYLHLLLTGLRSVFLEFGHLYPARRPSIYLNTGWRGADRTHALSKERYLLTIEVGRQYPLEYALDFKFMFQVPCWRGLWRQNEAVLNEGWPASEAGWTRCPTTRTYLY